MAIGWEWAEAKKDIKETPKKETPEKKKSPSLVDNWGGY